MFYVKLLVLAVFLTLINITDIKGFKIKNKIVFPTVLLGLVLGLISSSFLDSLYGMLIPLVLFPLYAFRMLGAGDVKALCAIGAVVGFDMSVKIMLITFVAGGVIALAFMIANRNFVQRFKNLFRYLKMCFVTKKPLAYDFGGGTKSYFRFSYAITAGVILSHVLPLW